MKVIQLGLSHCREGEDPEGRQCGDHDSDPDLNSHSVALLAVVHSTHGAMINHNPTKMLSPRAVWTCATSMPPVSGFCP